jgi:hypothetical protein
LLSTTENALAKFDLYYGGAAGHGTSKFNLGVEGSWSMRETVTRYSQAPATQAFQNEAQEQGNQAQWRHDKIAAEARRLGIDPADKSTNELIKLIHARWEEDPSARRPVFNPDHELTILELVNPERVMARGKDTHVIEAEDGDITMTALFTLVFWNVGGLAPGYDKAVMSVRVDSNHSDYNEEYTVEGNFSGGPNGTLDMDGETLSVVDGNKLVHPDGTYAISNPSAFAYWPTEFR